MIVIIKNVLKLILENQLRVFYDIKNKPNNSIHELNNKNKRRRIENVIDISTDSEKDVESDQASEEIIETNIQENNEINTEENTEINTEENNENTEENNEVNTEKSNEIRTLENIEVNTEINTQENKETNKISKPIKRKQKRRITETYNILGRKGLKLLLEYFINYGFPDGKYENWGIGEFLMNNLYQNYNITSDKLDDYIIIVIRHILGIETCPDFSKVSLLNEQNTKRILKLYYV